MSGRAAPRLLRAVVSAVESAAFGHLYKFKACNCSRAVSIRAFASVPCFAPGRLEEHRGSVLQLSSRHRFSNATPIDQGLESEDEGSEALATTLLKLQHDALEISGNGHPEKCAQASTDITWPMPLAGKHNATHHASRMKIRSMVLSSITTVCLRSHTSTSSIATCRASQMLDEASKLLADEPAIALKSQEAVGIFITHTTVLLRAGMFEKLSEVCNSTPAAVLVDIISWLMHLQCHRNSHLTALMDTVSY